MQRTLFSTLAALLLLGSIAPSSADDLSVPPQVIEGGTPEKMMRHYLLQQVEPAIKQWTWDYERRKTPEAIVAYQKSLREKVLDAIGGLPDRTPLNPQTAGIISRDGYRVEKVIFESQPKHYVSALCFLPDSSEHKPPYPGVIVPCGHSDLGKAFPTYQTMGALLALNGMAALVFDPIDQGERGQYLGEGGWPALKCTAAHTMLGTGCIALGRNTARFEIWDGMRAIDYLRSRPEVDPKRIGCTGCSGGGTQTSYLMALDDRIVAAAPSCYITSLSKLLTTAGPQDAEQNIFGQLAIGLDHADWLALRAPSPVLICSATHDFFDIGGTWESFRRTKRLYTRLGCAERIDLLESDAPHGYNRPHREGAARWMSRWLLGKDVAIKEPATIKLLTQNECLCVPNGKVMTLPGARSVYDLNEDYENELAKRRESLWRAENRTTTLQQVRKLAGIRTLSELPKPKVETVGNVARQGCKVERLLIKPESGISLPALWFLPEKPNSNRVVLYLHHQGKTADADLGGPIDRLVQAGSAALAVDLRGHGANAVVQAEGRLFVRVSRCHACLSSRTVLRWNAGGRRSGLRSLFGRAVCQRSPERGRSRRGRQRRYPGLACRRVGTRPVWAHRHQPDAGVLVQHHPQSTEQGYGHAFGPWLASLLRLAKPDHGTWRQTQHLEPGQSIKTASAVAMLQSLPTPPSLHPLLHVQEWTARGNILLGRRKP